MVSRITYVSIALLLTFYHQDSVADELEQGIQYSCSSSEVRLESIWKDGGGQGNPFNESDTETVALWNIDRLRRKLPILKVCQVGKHRITTVIFKQCAIRRWNWSVSSDVCRRPGKREQNRHRCRW